MSTIIEWYKNGGPIMNFILAVGVAGIAIFIERFYVIVIKSKINGRAFIERVISLVRAGKIDDGAAQPIGDLQAAAQINAGAGFKICQSRESSNGRFDTAAGEVHSSASAGGSENPQIGRRRPSANFIDGDVVRGAGRKLQANAAGADRRGNPSNGGVVDARDHIPNGIGAAQIDSGGSGYTTFPSATITGGTQQGTAIVVAGIGAINVVTGGSGYTAAPSVTARDSALASKKPATGRRNTQPAPVAQGRCRRDHCRPPRR